MGMFSTPSNGLLPSTGPSETTWTRRSVLAGLVRSESSSWNASTGSPSRSWRMTHAVIVLGSSPGSVSTLVMLLRSTAIGPGMLAAYVLMPRRRK